MQNDPTMPVQIASIETKIMNHLRDDPTGQHWHLRLSGDQWNIVLEALRRYQTHELHDQSGSKPPPIDGTEP